MKKNFKFYALGWFVLLGLFNLLAFIIPVCPFNNILWGNCFAIYKEV